MKVIDLLNKIANGEEVPNKFKFAGQIFEVQGSYIEDEEGDSIFESMFTDFSNINEEVEIIEEDKKIEKIIPTSLKGINNLNEKIEIAHIDTISAIDKINEIIDKLNSMED